MTKVIESDSIARAWELSLSVFADDHDLNRFDSTRGPCVEFEDLLIQSDAPSLAPQVSRFYRAAFLPLVESYAAGFLGEDAGRDSTVAKRLYSWGGSSGLVRNDAGVDQVRRAARLLRDEPSSRYNIVSLWDPAVDPELSNPVSPLICYFRIRGGTLRSTLVARTVDAWLGAFPMLIGFSRLHEALADEVHVVPGRIAFAILSYHVYEMDLPILRAMQSELR